MLVFTPEANSCAGSQEQDGADLLAGLGISIQEVRLLCWIVLPVIGQMVTKKRYY